jgi:hypothetical protein
MGLGNFAKRLLGSPEPVSAPVETINHACQHRSAPVDTDVQKCAPVDADTDRYPPLVFGSMRSAREHAEKIVEIIRTAGCCNRSIYQGEIEGMHANMCEELGWLPRLWPAVGRELAMLPGVRRGLVKFNGQRLTAYEISPATDVTAGAVELAAERKRDG